MLEATLSSGYSSENLLYVPIEALRGDTFVKIPNQLQDPWKMVIKSVNEGQTKTAPETARVGLVVHATLGTHAGLGRLTRFDVETGNNGLLTVIRKLVNSNIASCDSQSTRLTNTLIQRKVNYMKQNCRK